MEELTLHALDLSPDCVLLSSEFVRNITILGEGYVVSDGNRGDVRHMLNDCKNYLEPS